MSEDGSKGWNEEERNALAAHIEEGYLQAERGELIDDEQARHEIQMLKGSWRLANR
jgi:predicted transcriptional regulator